MLLTLSWFGHTASASGPNAAPFSPEQEGEKIFPSSITTTESFAVALFALSPT